jgi:hypothetical protein
MDTAKNTPALNPGAVPGSWYMKKVLVSVKPVAQPTAAKENLITLFSTLILPYQIIFSD